MKNRLLGKNGFEIGEVGLGCWQFGGDFGPMSEETAFAIMQAAVDNGVTFFDTADVYGGGLSESLIGRFLKESKASIKVATKFGRDGVYPDGYSRASLRTGIEASLKRIGVGCLDLVQLHCIPTQVMRDGEIFDWLREIKEEGLIANFGASVESVEDALICLEQDGLLSLQVIFNIFRQKLISELFPKAKEKGVGIIVRLPLASGLLAGKYTVDTQFAASDHRNYNRDGQAFNVGETFAGLPFEIGVSLADDIKSEVPERMNMAQMALRWILDYPEVSVIIPGASSPQQVVRNAVVSDLPALPINLHEKIAAIYQSSVSQHIRGPY